MHRMTASVMKIAILVSDFCVVIISLLIFIVKSKNDTAVVEYSFVKRMFG